MKARRLPMEDVLTIARIVILEAESEDENEDPFAEEGLKPGTYAMDGEGRVWRLDDKVTGLFQEFMDAGISKRRKRE